MISKWYEYKDRALKFRLKGESIRTIEKRLKIPRSTLSGWFKNIQLTEEQKAKLIQNSRLSLARARGKAIMWHRNQKNLRLKEARFQAKSVLSKLDTQNDRVLELALAMLYLGEGDKTNGLSIGNTDPQILKFFIKSSKILYGIRPSKMKCQLHLRSDQNKNEMIKFWAKTLKLLPTNFSAVMDKRIAKSKTYPEYKGVCVIYCGNIAIQRRLIYLARDFCNIIIARSVSSVWLERTLDMGKVTGSSPVPTTK